MEQMRVWRILISASTTFVITGGGAFVVALITSGGKMPGTAAMIASVLTGLMAAAKDTRSLMALPPVTNGNADALNKLLSTPPPNQGPQQKAQNETERHE